MKNVLKPLAKNVFIALQFIVAALAMDAAIHKEIFRSGIKMKPENRKADSSVC